jgi:predicted small secreted protein
MRRTLPPLAALAMVAVLGAGCSNTLAGAGTDSSTGNNTAATRQQAVKFAECMRSNGVKEFPDPDASGTLTIDGIANGSSLDTNSATFKQAIAACKDLQPAGFVGHKRTAQEQENALQFAQCIRDNGVKDFPDPTPDGPLVDTNRIPSAAGRGGPSIPGLTAAMQKCRDLAASAGVQGGR